MAVHGRQPTADDFPLVASAASDLRGGDRNGAFRRIVNGKDHQVLPTAFAVRFAQPDIMYVSVAGVEMAVDKRDAAVSQGLIDRAYEDHLLRFYQEQLKPGMVFVDIGANLGLYSILAARLVGATGKVLSFEPNSENCRLILLSAARNKFENILVIPMALGNSQGYALFTTHVGSNGGLIPDTVDTLLSPNCTVVPITRLASVYSDRIDMIKIDVEGAEGLVIEGAKPVIEQHRPVISSEFSLEMLPRVSRMSGTEYLQYFEHIGYDLYRIDRDSQALVGIQSIEEFIRTYGAVNRIEDLAFIPRNPH